MRFRAVGSLVVLAAVVVAGIVLVSDSGDRDGDEANAAPAGDLMATVDCAEGGSSPVGSSSTALAA